MEEAEALASTVGIIDRGTKVAEGTPAALIADLGSDVIRIVGTGERRHFISELGALPFVERVQFEGEDGVVQVYVDNGNRRLASVVAATSGNGFNVEDISLSRPTLGDVFMRYTGRALRDEATNKNQEPRTKSQKHQ